MAAQKKSHRGRTKASKLHCVLPSALSQVRGKKEDDQHTENPLIVSFCSTLLWLRDQISFFSPYDAKRREIIYKGQLQRGGLVPDIIH